MEEGSGSGSSLSDGEAEALVERLRECGGEIVTALFGISLAGDLPDGKKSIFCARIKLIILL